MLPIIFSLLHLAYCQNPISFLGSPNANTSIPSYPNITTLYAAPVAPNQPGAQLFYSILNPSEPSPLATVYLMNSATNLSQTIQVNFNVLTSTCSCYWVNSTDLLIAHPTITSSGTYYIQMVGAGFNVSSGLFAINTAGFVAPVPAPPPKAAPAANNNVTPNSTSKLLKDGLLLFAALIVLLF